MFFGGFGAVMPDAVAKAIDPAAGVIEAELRDLKLDDAGIRRTTCEQPSCNRPK